MSAFSDYLEDKLLRATLRGEPFTSPLELYVGLFTTATGDVDGTGEELVGNGYQRIRVTFGAPVDDIDSAKYCANDTDIRSPQPSTADWGTVSHWAVFDALAGGNRLYHGPLETPRVYETNDLFFAAAGDLKIKLS